MFPWPGFLLDTLVSLRVLGSSKFFGASAPVCDSTFVETSRFVLYNVFSCPFMLEVLSQNFIFVSCALKNGKS